MRSIKEPGETGPTEEGECHDYTPQTLWSKRGYIVVLACTLTREIKCL